jgi:hypothetical protein
MEPKAMKTFLASMTFLLFAAMVSDAVLAKTVSVAGNSRAKVEGRCGESGGVFWTEGKTGHTYGSMNPDGGGIVCSGVTAAQKKTCDTFRQAPIPHFPTRDEAAKGDLTTK